MTAIPPDDPLDLKAQADAALERAAARLRTLLHEAAARLRPFPPFPGAFFTSAIEVEPGPAASPDLGCVVVGEDGDLYELLIGVDLDSPLAADLADPVALRSERLQPLDLHPRDYLAYAYNALTAVIEHLLEQAPESA